jgi:hypothetical protein
VPGAPTGVTATAGNASALVSWTAPAANGGSAITAYTVTSSPGSKTCTTTGALTCTASGLTNGTSYTFTVTASNAIGTGLASTASAPITPATVPAKPTSVTATSGNAAVSVSWTAPADNGGSAIIAYTVTSSPEGKTCTTSGTSCTVGGLTNGTPYTFTVTATNGVGTGLPSTASAPVTPAAATSLTVSVAANPWPAGSAHSVTVKALDAYGNVATGYTGSIHFTTSDAVASVPANYKFTASDKGVHTFSYTLNPALTLKTAGSQAVRATDTLTASITGVQTGIVVTSAAATALIVLGIVSPYVAGSAHSVTVRALDAYGNTATGYRGTIHFNASDPSASVPANYTFTAADNGVHTFSYTLNPALTLKTAGSQAVRATDTLTASITGVQTITVT